MAYKVVDVSKYNGDRPAAFWDGIKSSCTAAICRAGIRGYGSAGTLSIDSKVRSYIKELDARSIPWGVYMISMAVTVAEAKEEVDWLEKQFGDLSEIAWGVWIDVEESGGKAQGKGSFRADNLSKSARTTIVKAWCDYAASKGAYVGIYSSTSWFKTMMDDSQLTGYAHWVAQYSSKCTYSGTIVGWQFSASNAFNIPRCIKDNGKDVLDCSYFYVKVSDYVMTESAVKSIVNSAISAKVTSISSSVSTLTASVNTLTATVAKMAPTDANLQAGIDELKKLVAAAEEEIANVTNIDGTGDEYPAWAKQYVEWALANGIFKGCNGDLGWEKAPSRAQLAVIIKNIYDYIDSIRVNEDAADESATAVTVVTADVTAVTASAAGDTVNADYGA